VSWNPDDKWRTALHEAGHAVVLSSFDIAVQSIYLDPVKESGGTIPVEPLAVAQLDVDRHMAFALAGYLSERLFKPPPLKRKARYNRLETIPVALRWHAIEDTRQQCMVLKRGGNIARQRLRDRQVKVLRVAYQLFRHGRLDRATFESIMAT
jgi:hypothetical protein